jgi:uncharacterized coiled-coil DUF342 family protein
LHRHNSSNQQLEQLLEDSRENEASIDELRAAQHSVDVLQLRVGTLVDERDVLSTKLHEANQQLDELETANDELIVERDSLTLAASDAAAQTEKLDKQLKSLSQEIEDVKGSVLFMCV